jgi:hypothetical protein
VPAPWFLYIPVISFALPVLAAGRRQRQLDLPMRYIAGWYALLVVENLTAVIWRDFSATGNNLIVGKIFMPLEGTLVLLALAEWQVQPVARTAVRLLIPLYFVAWAFGMLYVEQSNVFSIFAGPILGFLVLGASLFAYVSRMQQEERPVLETAWGWIVPGLSIFFAINVTVTIMLAIMQSREQWDMMKQAVYLQVWIYFFATLIVTAGFLWPTRHRSSGASSSPSPSP